MPIERRLPRRSVDRHPAATMKFEEHPLKDLISHQLVRYLEKREIKHIFGMCGHTNVAVLTALANSSVHFVSVRHEQVAAHAADGYARTSGTTSVLLTHIGPGLTNAVTGVATAAMDSIPIVVISGDVPRHFYGRNAFQEINLHADASQADIFKPFVKRAWRVDVAELFPEIIDKAFRLAASGRPGPVLVSVPMDVFSEAIDVSLFDRLNLQGGTLGKPGLDEAEGEKIIQAVLHAKRPVVYVGGGVVRAGAAGELRDFADHLSLPVAHSQIAKGTLPDDHPMGLGLTGFWGTKFVNEMCRNADLILALGTRFMESDTSSWNPAYTFAIPPARLIQIDIDPNEIGRYYPVEIGAVADLGTALAALNRISRKLSPRPVKRDDLAGDIAAARAALHDGHAAAAASNDFPMRPERILSDIRTVLPRDAIISTDTGWSKNGVAQQFPVYEPGSVLTPGGFATMGFGPPAALGAKIAAPHRVVVSLAGDGAFGANPAMLATAVEEKAAVIWIVLNNFSFGTIAGLQRAHFGTTVGTLFQVDSRPYSPDYAAMAESYGAIGIKVRKATEFRPALEKAIRSGRPAVIDVEMLDIPVSTSGHWDINDIYAGRRRVSGVE